MNTPSDTLAEFGVGFQTKTISVLLTDQNFLSQTNDIISIDYFDSDARKWIVNTILVYYKEYRNCPSMEVFKAETSKVVDEVLKIAVVEQLKASYQQISSGDISYIRDKFLEFCKNQSIKNAILRSVDLLGSSESSKFEKIKDTINTAYNAGSSLDLGHVWKDELEKRLTRGARPGLPTGWKIIDQTLDGGLSFGELGVIVGASGAGKSYFLTSIGAHAMKMGKNIIHYTLELNASYQGIRYDSAFTHVSSNEIIFHKDEVQKAMDKVPGSLLIKYFPTKTATVSALHSHAQQVIATGFIPDLIIVDYGDLLSSSKNEDSNYEAMGSTYEELRGFAGELKVPLWTASQGNRSSINEDILLGDKIADSYKKIMTADYVMSLSRTPEDKINGTGRIHIIKNRFGLDGMTFPASIDYGKFQIDIYEGSNTEHDSNNKLVSDMLKQRKNFQV